MKRVLLIAPLLVACSTVVKNQDTIANSGKLCIKRVAPNLIEATYYSCSNKAVLDIAQSSGILEFTTYYKSLLAKTNKECKRDFSFTKNFTISNDNSLQLSWNGRFLGRLEGVKRFEKCFDNR
jgi:hypothetical protein